MAFSQRAHEGYLFVDHRASPGLPKEYAQKVGLGNQARFLGEGKVFETFTFGCPHCGACVVMNPDRSRERHHCRKCDRYICDGCHAHSTEPDYEHMTFEEVRDDICSGRAVFGPGSTACRPVLIYNISREEALKTRPTARPHGATPVAPLGSPPKLLMGG